MQMIPLDESGHQQDKQIPDTGARKIERRRAITAESAEGKNPITCSNEEQGSEESSSSRRSLGDFSAAEINTITEREIKKQTLVYDGLQPINLVSRIRAPLPPFPGIRIDAAMVSEIEAASMAFSDRSVPLLLLHWVLLLVERFCSFQPEPDSKEKSKETGRSLLLCMPKP